MKLAPLLRWLDSLINVEAKPTAGSVGGLTLDNIKALLALLGDPQGDVPAIHVTGTNGKGSTTHLVSRILDAHGVSVGTYASPHVEALNERIQLGVEPISDEQLAEALTDVKLVADHIDANVSWFEVMTATAYRVFNDAAVQAAAIEVGMLGRYDATNVANTAVAVVTNIARDHTDGAPGWREAIAGEKAGIITPDSTLVLGDVGEDLAPIFRSEGAAKIVELGRDFSLQANDTAVNGRVIDVRTSRGIYEQVFVGLHGAHQAQNAMLAMVAAEEFLDGALDEELLGQAFMEPSMPARFEIVSREPLIILDGSHNPAGAATAAATLRSDFSLAGRRYLLLGWMQGRDPIEMLEAFDATSAELVVITEPRWPRVMPAAEIAEAARELGVPHEVVSDPLDGFDRVRSLAFEEDVILVAGSFYLAGPIRTSLRTWDNE